MFHLSAAVCGEADFTVVAYDDSVDHPKDYSGAGERGW